MKHAARFSKTLILGVMLALLIAACSPSEPATVTQAGPDLGATQAALEATQAALSAAQTDAAKQAE